MFLIQHQSYNNIRWEIVRRVNGVGWNDLDTIPAYDFMYLWRNVEQLIKQEQDEAKRQNNDGGDTSKGIQNKQKSLMNSMSKKAPKIGK